MKAEHRRTGIVMAVLATVFLPASVLCWSAIIKDYLDGQYRGPMGINILGVVTFAVLPTFLAGFFAFCSVVLLYPKKARGG